MQFLKKVKITYELEVMINAKNSSHAREMIQEGIKSKLVYTNVFPKNVDSKVGISNISLKENPVVKVISIKTLSKND